MWVVGAWSVGAGDKASSGAMTKLGKNPTGQSLKRQTNAVLTGKCQCQPGGKQGAKNERGGHGKEISMGKGECADQFRQASSAISTATHSLFAKS